MTRTILSLFAGSALLAAINLAGAQQPGDGPPGPPPRPRGDRQGLDDERPGPPPPPPHALLEFFDGDQDGSISADEISKAADVLKKMDANADGKLTREELPPPPHPPRPHRRGHRGGPPRGDGPPPYGEQGRRGPPPRDGDRGRDCPPPPRPEDRDE